MPSEYYSLHLKIHVIFTIFLYIICTFYNINTTYFTHLITSLTIIINKNVLVNETCMYFKTEGVPIITSSLKSIFCLSQNQNHISISIVLHNSRYTFLVCLIKIFQTQIFRIPTLSQLCPTATHLSNFNTFFLPI